MDGTGTGGGYCGGEVSPASEPVVDACGLRVQAEVELTLAVAEWDARKVWAMEGARSAVGWLSFRCGISRPDAGRVLRRARLVRRLGGVADGLAAGKLSLGAADLLAATATDDRLELTRRDKDLLLEAADRLSIPAFEQYLRRWRCLADDALADADAVSDHERGGLHLSRTLRGRWVLGGDLSDEEGELLSTALTDHMRPDTAGEHRTPRRRRLDALMELAGAGPGRLDVTAIVTWDVLAGHGDGAGDGGQGGGPPEQGWRCDLGEGPLARSVMQRWLCDAALRRVVMRGRSEVVDVGRRSRVIPPQLRVALVVRDGGCVAAGCDQGPRRCQAHHLVPWSEGGPTDLDNLALLCAYHHRLVHEGRHRPIRGPDGTLTLTPT